MLLQSLEKGVDDQYGLLGTGGFYSLPEAVSVPYELAGDTCILSDEEKLSIKGFRPSCDLVPLGFKTNAFSCLLLCGDSYISDDFHGSTPPLQRWE